MGIKPRSKSTLTAGEVGELLGCSPLRVRQLAPGYFTWEGPDHARRYHTSRVMLIKSVADQERAKAGTKRVPWLRVTTNLLQHHRDEFPELLKQGRLAAKKGLETLKDRYRDMGRGNLGEIVGIDWGHTDDFRESVTTFINRDIRWRIGVEEDYRPGPEIKHDILAELADIVLEMQQELRESDG